MNTSAKRITFERNETWNPLAFRLKVRMEYSMLTIFVELLLL